MAELELLTVTHGPDLELFRILRETVVAFAGEDTLQRIVVPRPDLVAFRQEFEDRSTEILVETTAIPRHLVSVQRVRRSLSRRLPWLPQSVRSVAAVNLRRPYPPVRGWVYQQLLKLSVAAASNSRVVLLADSNLALVRPLDPELFVRDGSVRLYRWDRAVHAAMPRHLAWHRNARRLLGLGDCGPPYHDYVAGLVSWDPDLVRRMLARIESVTGRPWVDALGAELDLSEYTLYGTFVDEVADEGHYSSDDDLCHCHWEPVPLDRSGAGAFADSIGAEDVAVLVQSTSKTDLGLRRAVIGRITGAARV